MFVTKLSICVATHVLKVLNFHRDTADENQNSRSYAPGFPTLLSLRPSGGRLRTLNLECHQLLFL